MPVGKFIAMLEQRPPIQMRRITMQICIAIAVMQSAGILGGATTTSPPLLVDGIRARTAPIGPKGVVGEDNGNEYRIVRS